MNWHRYNGLPIKAIHLLMRADRLRKQVNDALKAPTESENIRYLEKQRDELQKQVSAIENTIFVLREQENKFRSESLSHLRSQATAFTSKANELIRSVPQPVKDFIAVITNGVNWSSGFQIVWYSDTHLILRLAGRHFWNGIGSRAYAQAETKLYDLRKFQEMQKKGGPKGGFGGLSAERECLVKSVRGRISAKQLKEWKEESEYAAV